MSTHGDGGKGSGRRPGEGYQDGWERIFAGNKKGPSGPVLASAPSAPTGQSPTAIVTEKCGSKSTACMPPLGRGAMHCTQCTQSALSSGCTVGASECSAPHSPGGSECTEPTQIEVWSECGAVIHRQGGSDGK